VEEAEGGEVQFLEPGEATGVPVDAAGQLANPLAVLEGAADAGEPGRRGRRGSAGRAAPGAGGAKGGRGGSPAAKKKGKPQTEAEMKESLLERLQEYVDGMGGVLEEGWQCTVKKRTGRTTAGTWYANYLSPEGKRFRSRQEVGRHLELKAQQAAEVVSREQAEQLAKELPALEGWDEDWGLPLTLASGAAVQDLGAVNVDNDLYHTETDIFPVGFVSRWMHPEGKVVYVSAVVEGTHGPLFRVTSETLQQRMEGRSTLVATGVDPFDAWIQIEDPHAKQFLADWKDPFGLYNVEVGKRIEALPGAEACTAYQFVAERGSTWEREEMRIVKEANELYQEYKKKLQGLKEREVADGADPEERKKRREEERLKQQLEWERQEDERRVKQEEKLQERMKAEALKQKKKLLAQCGIEDSTLNQRKPLPDATCSVLLPEYLTPEASNLLFEVHSFLIRFGRLVDRYDIPVYVKLLHAFSLDNCPQVGSFSFSYVFCALVHLLLHEIGTTAVQMEKVGMARLGGEWNAAQPIASLVPHEGVFCQSWNEVLRRLLLSMGVLPDFHKTIETKPNQILEYMIDAVKPPSRSHKKKPNLFLLARLEAEAVLDVYLDPSGPEQPPPPPPVEAPPQPGPLGGPPMWGGKSLTEREKELILFEKAGGIPVGEERPRWSLEKPPEENLEEKPKEEEEEEDPRAILRLQQRKKLIALSYDLQDAKTVKQLPLDDQLYILRTLMDVLVDSKLIRNAITNSIEARSGTLHQVKLSHSKYLKVTNPNRSHKKKKPVEEMPPPPPNGPAANGAAHGPDMEALLVKMEELSRTMCDESLSTRASLLGEDRFGNAYMLVSEMGIQSTPPVGWIPKLGRLHGFQEEMFAYVIFVFNPSQPDAPIWRVFDATNVDALVEFLEKDAIKEGALRKALLAHKRWIRPMDEVLPGFKEEVNTFANEDENANIAKPDVAVLRRHLLNFESCLKEATAFRAVTGSREWRKRWQEATRGADTLRGVASAMILLESTIAPTQFLARGWGRWKHLTFLPHEYANETQVMLRARMLEEFLYKSSFRKGPTLLTVYDGSPLPREPTPEPEPEPAPMQVEAPPPAQCVPAQPKPKPKPTRKTGMPRGCTVCRQPGHNARTCPVKKAQLAEEAKERGIPVEQLVAEIKAKEKQRKEAKEAARAAAGAAKAEKKAAKLTAAKLSVGVKPSGAAPGPAAGTPGPAVAAAPVGPPAPAPAPALGAGPPQPAVFPGGAPIVAPYGAPPLPAAPLPVLTAVQAAERLVNSEPLPAPPPVAVHEPQPAPAAAGPAAETGQPPAPAGIAGPADMETGA